MGGSILLLLYGLCSIGAGFNFPAWARLAWLRALSPKRIKPWWQDTILLARVGVTLLAFGSCGLAAVRTIASLFGDVKLQVPSPAGLLFIGSMAAAEPFFLRVDEVHKRAMGKHSHLWVLYLLTAAAWTLSVFLAWLL